MDVPYYMAYSLTSAWQDGMRGFTARCAPGESWVVERGGGNGGARWRRGRSRNRRSAGEAHASVEGEWIVVGAAVGRCRSESGRRSREAVARERREAREMGPGACGEEGDA